jgi:queuosine precursor transporter
MTGIKPRVPAGIGLLAVYITSIVLANWLTTRYGLVTLFPGLTATAGTLAVGGVVMTRDFVQDALGRAVILGAIVLGAGLSYGLSSHQIAVASGVTFLIEETLELLVYTPLRRRAGWGTGRWGGVVGTANATGIIADTFLFLYLAGFPVTAGVVGGQLLGKAYVTAAVVLAGVVIRRSVLRQSVVTVNS